ncbi:uncharacterized protein LOC134280339 [Saccostrea cucullata]|uniref:uncharacterized protein LOC134280339 n=1 Tax=Saccostrea cuccullata TaxID=36930 RepID=UPI002ED6572C
MGCKYQTSSRNNKRRICRFGETHVHSLLAALNIPSVSQITLKNRGREVGQQFGQLAGETCNESLQEEMRLSEGSLAGISDGAWQKRGTGRAYNSLTGLASLLEKNPRK